MSQNKHNSIIVQNSLGINFVDGPEKFGGNSSSFKDVQETKIKFLCVSENGQCIAWICNGEVCVVEGPEWKRIGTLQHQKALEVCFSPTGKYLAIYDIYQVSSSGACNNLSIYDVMGKKLLNAFPQKSQTGWKPQWTKDEELMGLMPTSEVHFYESHDLQKPKQKVTLAKCRSFSLSPSVKTHHSVFYVPSLKGAPGFVQLLKYPNFTDRSNIVARQSFFKMDSVEAFWNKPCTAVLLLGTTEVDKSSGSYYGEQHLFFLNTKGDSNRITFSKGSIRSVMWCPSGSRFFCIYGASPSRATMYDLKCEPVAEFGEGARNFLLVNPPGNLVLIGAMGNMTSRFEVWDIKQCKKIAFKECPDITHMEWSPCGKYILTSTCSPRLRVNNGFRVWHYTASLLHENIYQNSQELFSAAWLPDPASAKSFDISEKPVKGIESQISKASNQRYIPPSQRVGGPAKPDGFVDTSTKFLSQREKPLTEEDKAKLLKKQKQLEKRREKKEKKRADKEVSDWRNKMAPEKTDGDVAVKTPANANATKKPKQIRKKLEEIKKLKMDQETGKSLNEDQLKKIANENALVEELKQLEIRS